MKYLVTREGGLFVIRMAPADFADFAFEQLVGEDEPKSNGEPAKRRGRPPKDSQQALAEGEVTHELRRNGDE